MIEKKQCFHCGDLCGAHSVYFDDKDFCCNGCKTVYEIFSENDLISYYELQNAPGITPDISDHKYDFLKNTAIANKLVDFNDGNIQIATLSIPNIHCSSCIWVLENLNKLNKHITSSFVNFGKKTVRVTYNSEKSSLFEIAILLNRIGYEPNISLDSLEGSVKKKDRSLVYKLGIAGFAFGNVMFLSFPEYLDFSSNNLRTVEYWLEEYKHLFRWLMFAFSIPVVFFAAQDYFKSAFKGIKSNMLNIDVPIALGILVLFVRSTAEIIFDLGSGFFDSLTGLVFFLLLGKFFQQKTYSYLSFERDYKSYFPVAVTKINNNGTENSVQILDVKKGDRLLIRNNELIPVDGILMKGRAEIDYSFVTGESKTVFKASGDQIFAGGKQTLGVIEMEAVKTVEQSHLTQLWSKDIFKTNKNLGFANLTNAISKNFTIAVLSIASIATLFWLIYMPEKAMNVFTAVLIIACPCAIALSAPFTYGNVLRILGRAKFYLKNSSVIEELARIDTIVFDKTGTITSNKKSNAIYEGAELSIEQETLLKNTLRASNHPLSRKLYEILDENNIISLDHFEEILGQGISASHLNEEIKVGSANFVGVKEHSKLSTSVYVSTNNSYKGKFTFFNRYRKGVSKLFKSLSNNYELAILSGDNDGELKNLKKLLPAKTKFMFNQSPEQKLEYIEHHQNEGSRILMVGDGLNDAGALAQSSVGIAISENTNVFSPACDAILDASKFDTLENFIKLTQHSVKIVKWSFGLAFIYNIIGLYFAVTGQLSPVIAAILMPLSSISIVVFTTMATNLLGRKIN
ncbi:MAG: heavy metal translocating P-type ATPase metal-binding domain-containing protein [Bacteroidota bacterium]